LEVINVALKPKDQKFLDAYFANGFNGTDALISIQPPNYYKDRRVAGAAAWQLLQRVDVKEEMERRLIAWRASNQLTVEQFGQQLQDAIKVEISDFFDRDGFMKPWEDIPPHARRQIASIEFESICVGEDPITDERKYRLVPKIKLWDRRKAEELWGRWKKMYTDKLEHGGEGGGPVRVAFSITGIKKGQDNG
jgi:hypothetical protein